VVLLLEDVSGGRQGDVLNGCSIADAEHVTVVVLDWQTASVGPPAGDVAFVFDSLSVDDRRAAEDELFNRYLTVLSLHGVRGYSAEALRTECGLALLVRLAGTVGWLSSLDRDLLSERERALQDAVFGNGRLVAALLDHDVGSLLADPTLAP
jgi:Protein of unknown function (DUF1679)